MKIKPVRRTIYLWRKANITDLKKTCEKFSQEFIQKYTTASPIEDMWNNIKYCLTEMQGKFVPSKTSSVRHHQPWISSEVKKVSRRKKRSFKKYKRTGKFRDLVRYNELKLTSRKTCRAAFNNYLNNMIEQTEDSNHKRFWAIIKGRRENTGIAPLKNIQGVTY
jgi:hypothetical protein